jgi:hypothetical protein
MGLQQDIVLESKIQIMWNLGEDSNQIALLEMQIQFSPSYYLLEGLPTVQNEIQDNFKRLNSR